MKIVVLAGGLSPERNVSLSTGTMVTEALRALGHRAGLIDLYFGLETGGADEAFFDAPVSEAYKKISREAPDLDQVRRGRKGDSTIIICTILYLLILIIQNYWIITYI